MATWRNLDASELTRPTNCAALPRVVEADGPRSLADLRVVVAREPRHYTALAGLGVILQDIGEEKRALEAYRRAVEANPHIQVVPERMKKLQVKVEGRDI